MRERGQGTLAATSSSPLTLTHHMKSDGVRAVANPHPLSLALHEVGRKASPVSTKFRLSPRAHDDSDTFSIHVNIV